MSKRPKHLYEGNYSSRGISLPDIMWDALDAKADRERRGRSSLVQEALEPILANDPFFSNALPSAEENETATDKQIA